MSFTGYIGYFTGPAGGEGRDWGLHCSFDFTRKLKRAGVFNKATNRLSAEAETGKKKVQSNFSPIRSPN